MLFIDGDLKDVDKVNYSEINSYFICIFRYQTHHMKVIKSTPSKTPLVTSSLGNIDFQDAFTTTNTRDSLEIITKKIFGTAPRWVSVLMKIRNGIVRLFGIRSEGRPTISKEFKKGGHVYFFNIYEIEENEVLLGADDRHLDFRVSVLKEEKSENNVKVTTIVNYKNRLGRIYMWFVKPFHRMVVKRMVKQAFYSI